MPKTLLEKSQNPLIARAEKRGIDVEKVPHDELCAAMSALRARSKRGDGRPRAMLDLIERGLAIEGKRVIVSTGDERNVPVVVVKVRDTDLVVRPIVNGQRSAQKYLVLPVHVIGPAPG